MKRLTLICLLTLSSGLIAQASAQCFSTNPPQVQECQELAQDARTEARRNKDQRQSQCYDRYYNDDYAQFRECSADVNENHESTVDRISQNERRCTDAAWREYRATCS